MKKLRILQDASAISPREDYNLGTITLHPRVNLQGDGKTYDNAFPNKDDIKLPIYIYEHGCMELSTRSWVGRAQHAAWDSYLGGYIYVSKKRVRAEFDVNRIGKKLKDRVLDILANEVETYGHYVNGRVYGYILEEDGEEVDSCWGFYGYNWDKNWMKNYITEEVWDQLDNIEIEY